jgi:hypothetical protein
VRLLSKKELEALSTQRLLAYKASIMRCTDGPDWDSSSGQISKSDPRWKAAYGDLKEVLSGREHVPKKEE